MRTKLAILGALVVGCSVGGGDGGPNADSRAAVAGGFEAADLNTSDTEPANGEEKLCNREDPPFPVDIGKGDSVEVVANELVVPYSASALLTEELTVKPLLVRNGDVERAPETSISKEASTFSYRLPEPIEDGEEIIVALEFHAGNQWAWSDKVELVAKGGNWEPADSPVVFTKLGEVPPSPGEPPLTGEEIPSSQSSAEVLAHLREAGFNDEIILPPEKGVSLKSTSTRICLKQLVTQVGEGVGEDIFTSDTYYNSRYLLLYIPGVSINYLDASGCVYADISGWNTFTVYSVAGYDSRYIRVGTNGPPLTLVSRSFSKNIVSGVTNTLNWAPPTTSHHFNITLFGLMALMRWPGSWQGTYNFYTFAGSSGYNAFPSHDIYIGSGDDKVLVTHELGHCFFYRNSDYDWQTTVGYDYSETGSGVCISGSGSHDIQTIELATSSANEAAATFYGAVSYNYMDEAPYNNCRLYHINYQTGFDCLVRSHQRRCDK